ncbi:MAG TPA: sulfatase-like hydrolase/transferase [Tepidisphaeraceae bacterium]|nr:sulfatase-like hydrolase/transferase [Tepidisphaeraceae bacterium]
MISRRRFLSLMSASTAGLLSSGLLAAGASTARRPNVIVIVADDVGYADVSCHPGRDVRTPNIDSIAKNGIDFTHGYVSAPMCSPSRAGLMTGRYQQRFGHECNPPLDEERGALAGLPLSQRTLADVLKANGYATGLVGKWHLGLAAAFHPLKRGFQEFFGFLNSSHAYVVGADRSHEPICRNYTPVAEKEYLTDAFTREAVGFIQRHKAEPFFLYLPYNACHIPMDPPPAKYLERFAHITNEKRRLFCAMLAAVDDGVGAVLNTLRQLNLEEDTLVFFLSDNGGPTAGTSSRNDPYHGGKGGLWEGGIHVPFVAQWKNHWPAGQTCEDPIIALDIFPTALAAAGIATPPEPALDGVNLLPLLSGQDEEIPHASLCWRFRGHKAIRRGNWKLMVMPEGQVYLFNIVIDPGEAHDVSAQYPDLVKQLGDELNGWNSQLMEPAWDASPSSQGQKRKAKGGRNSSREALDAE